MNWLDKAIGAVSPAAALRREQQRQAFDMLRSYDAARRGRRTEGWRAHGSSANNEVGGAIVTVRNRSRDLIRNNPHARRAFMVWKAKAIGTGIQARPEKGASAAWKEFVDTCDYEGDTDFNGLQAMMGGTAFESGEVLVRRIRLQSGRVPLQLQVLEPDYLDGTRFGATSGGNYIIAGVEVDRRGIVQAYWLYDQHPGESVLLPRGLESKRVPVSEVFLYGEKERPGQLRFMCRLASAVMRLRDVDDYNEAMIVRKKIEACFAAFVVGGDPQRPIGEATINATTGKRKETLSPGMIEYVPAGTDVKFGAPSAASDLGFTVDQLRAIAVGAGITYEQLTGDLSRVNYSSIRSGMADFRDLVEQWRWLSFIPKPMRIIKGWFLDAAWSAGTIRTKNYAFTWTPPAWPYVNPVDDIKAIKEEIRGGLQSLSEKIRERGYDPEVVFDEMQKERQTLAQKGLVVDTDAATPAKPVAAVAPAPDPVDGSDTPKSLEEDK